MHPVLNLGPQWLWNHIDHWALISVIQLNTGIIVMFHAIFHIFGIESYVNL
jgi:hypothetical protein